MPKKVKNENIEASNMLEIDEIIKPTNEFDLSVLKSDFDKAEKQAKDAFQDDLIRKADNEKKSETTETVQDETEKIQDLRETLTELLEMVLMPINKSFGKKDISQFDAKFIDKLIDKITKLIPKNKLQIVEQFLGAGNKANTTLQILRIFRFISFVFKESYTRYDEYQVYKETHPTAKDKQLIDKS